MSVDELFEEREFLLRSLDDLERERAAGDIDDDDYRTLKDDYTVRTAAVLRAIDQAAQPLPPPPAARSWVRPAAWVVSVAVLAVTAGLVVAGSSGERLPGDPSAGGITATGPSRKLTEARALIGQGKAAEAIERYDEVLDIDPRNAEALAYRGWLVRLAGRQAGEKALLDKGLEYVSRAVEVDPAYPDAHFFKGMMLFEDRNDPAAAVPEFRAFLGLNPPQEMVPMVEGVLKQALQASGQPSG
ncbi:MAG TPA: tetratricopeptide repeat protein [Acidimicrobiales bacterium]|nr:tetratricopeptide repeat protein [Acidimicrobiales bacterium]